MILKSLIIGVLLGGAVLCMAIGLKKPMPGAVGMGITIIAALISSSAAFVLVPVFIFILIILPPSEGTVISSGYRITALSGPLSGRSYTLTGSKPSLYFGREKCKVLFPPDTPGVSRRHCSVTVRDGVPYLMDLGSHYGTFLVSPAQRLSPNVPVALTENKCFCLARNDFMFVINKIQ